MVLVTAVRLILFLLQLLEAVGVLAGHVTEVMFLKVIMLEMVAALVVVTVMLVFLMGLEVGVVAQVVTLVTGVTAEFLGAEADAVFPLPLVLVVEEAAAELKPVLPL